MKEYFLQIGESIQKGIAGVGEKSQEEVSKTQEFSDIPGYSEEKPPLFLLKNTSNFLHHDKNQPQSKLRFVQNCKPQFLRKSCFRHKS